MTEQTVQDMAWVIETAENGWVVHENTLTSVSTSENDERCEEHQDNDGRAAPHEMRPSVIVRSSKSFVFTDHLAMMKWLTATTKTNAPEGVRT